MQTSDAEIARKKRKGEIALKILKHMARTKGTHLKPSEIQVELSNLSMDLAIPENELRKFGKEIFQELLDDSFKEKN